jgi:hypothetical protein
MDPLLVERIDGHVTVRGRSRFIVNAIEMALEGTGSLPAGYEEALKESWDKPFLADPLYADRAARTIVPVRDPAGWRRQHLPTCSCAVCKPVKK